MAAEIVGILLAAGRGSRFGSDKLLHLLPDGTPMAVAAARNLRQACGDCVTVLRPEQEILGALLRAEGFSVHFSPKVAAGMGHSLAEAVRTTPDAAGWLVALADMPRVSPATLTLVAYALRGGARLAAPFYRGTRGHPVGFARDWYRQLVALKGDQGARRILADHPEVLFRVPCDDAGVVADIDTPAALEQLFRNPVT